MRTARVLALVALGLVAAPARAGCLARSSVADVEERLASAERAYVELDADGFGRALDDATLLLPCLDGVAPPPVAAAFHRLDALRLYAAGEGEEATASMRAARVLDPSYVFPDDLLPPDHALRRGYEALPALEGRTERPPRPREGSLAFDGTLTTTRPLDRATIVQLVADDGGAELTRMVRPGEPLPSYAAVPRTRQRLLVASGALLAVSGVFYGLAWSRHGPFWEPGASLAELERYQSQSYAYTAVSATSLGLGATGVVLAFGVADTSPRQRAAGSGRQ